MKKILSLILALTLILALAVPAFAGSENSTEITTTVGEGYTVSIPESLNITDSTLSTPLGGIKLTRANIAATKRVKVSLTPQSETVNTLKLTSDENEIVFAVKKDGADFSEAYLTKIDDVINLTIDITQLEWYKAPAGEYSGTISFTVALENRDK